MTRKWIKRLVVVILALAIGVVGLQVVLRFVSEADWTKRLVTEKLSAVVGRDVRLGRLSVGVNRLGIEEFSLAKEGGFEKGTDLHVQQLYLKLSWWHLLRGHVKIVTVRIDGLMLHVVRDAQGKLNRQVAENTPSGPATQDITDETPGLPVGLSVQEVSFRNMQLSYWDEQQQIQAHLKDTDLFVYDFSLEDPFDVRLNTSFVFQRGGQEQIFPLGISLKLNLADLDLSKSTAALKDLSVRNGLARLHLSGNITNFTEPVFSVRAAGKNLSQEVLRGGAEGLPEFSVPELTMSVQGALAPEARMWRLDEATLNLPGLQASGNGKGNWGRATYSFTATLHATLDELEKQLALLKPYKLRGNLEAQAHGSQQEISTQLEWKEGSAVFAQTGKFSNVEAAFNGNGAPNGQRGEGSLKLEGKLNEEPFKTDIVIAQTPARIAVGLKAAADRLVLPPVVSDGTKTADASADVAWPLPPLDIKADVQIGSLDVPYLNGYDLRFKTDLTGVTPKLTETHGKFDFSIGKGTITDLYQLTNSNPLAKILFLSLSVVGKVFNSLDVLSVLGGIAGGGKDSDGGEEVVQMIPGEDGEPVAIKVPASSRKMEGVLPYDKLVTRIDFNEGLATVEEGHFVSSMMSFKLSGTTDFNTEKLNMTVKAAPGKHETDGIMPLTLKIGGTVSDPKGSMRLMRSVTLLVTQGVTNNFASRAVKNTVGGFFGLFKKKDKEELPQTQEAPADTGADIPAETAEPGTEP